MTANILKSKAPWEARRGLASSSGQQIGIDLFQGTRKIQDLSTQEIKVALDYHKHSYQDCFDLDSLRKRLAECMVQTNQKQQQVMATFIQHLPQLHFTISKEITGFDKEALLLIPFWQYQQVGAVFKKSGVANDDPEAVAARERGFLVHHFQRERQLSSLQRDPRQDAQIGTAALLLWFHGGDDAKNIRRVDERDRGQNYKQDGIPYKQCILCLPPVPKNWKYDPHNIEELKAIECARQIAGECEAIEGIEDIEIVF